MVMVSEWEKQILAYCIRVSRGAVSTGMIKMSIFPEETAVSLGGVTAVQFIDIVSYVLRLQENLTDPIRRRGFKCSLEIGHKVSELLEAENYNIASITKNFDVKEHDGYASEVHFCFNYAPLTAPAMIFEDIDVVELNADDDMESILNSHEKNLELSIQAKFVQEFDFIDTDTSQEEPQETPQNTKKKKTKS